MRKGAWFLLAAWALALSSCWAPYYDPEVSASVELTDKLGEPFLSIGPVSGSGTFDSSTEGFEFLPSRPYGSPASPTEGFLVQKGEDRIRIAFVEKEGGGYGFAPMSQDASNYLGSSAVLRSEASTAAGYPQMIAIGDHSSLRQYQFNRSTMSLIQSETPNTSTTCVKVYGAGAGLYDIANDVDLYSVLFTDGTLLLMSTGQIGNSLGAFADLYATSLNSGGRSVKSGGNAFFDAGLTNFFYAEPDGPTLRWSGATMPGSPPVELAISRPLRAVLSDGTLVAQDDLRMSAYTAGGKELFTILAGSIRVQHEVYSYGPSPAAGYYLFLSQVLRSGKSDSDKTEFTIKVWRCRLADFKKLGD
jgi:hypothetical protein